MLAALGLEAAQRDSRLHVQYSRLGRRSRSPCFLSRSSTTLHEAPAPGASLRLDEAAVAAVSQPPCLLRPQLSDCSALTKRIPLQVRLQRLQGQQHRQCCPGQGPLLQLLHRSLPELEQQPAQAAA